RFIDDTMMEKEFGAKPGLPYGKIPQHELELSSYWKELAAFFVKYMDARAHTQGDVSVWAFKDPRATVLHDMWMDHFDVIIGVFRAPQEVAASYVGKGWITGFGKEKTAMGYWKRFNQSLLEVHRRWGTKKQMYVLDYNRPMETQTRMLC